MAARWRHGDRDLESDPVTGTLQLLEVGRSQEGSYACVADNRYGSIQTEVEVQVSNSNDAGDKDGSVDVAGYPRRAQGE